MTYVLTVSPLTRATPEMSPAAALRQLHCETAYVQKVLEDTKHEVVKKGRAEAMEEGLGAYRKRIREKEEILEADEAVKKSIGELRAELADLQGLSWKLNNFKVCVRWSDDGIYCRYTMLDGL